MCNIFALWMPVIFFISKIFILKYNVLKCLYIYLNILKEVKIIVKETILLY